MAATIAPAPTTTLQALVLTAPHGFEIAQVPVRWRDDGDRLLMWGYL